LVQLASLGNTYDDIIRWIKEAPIPDFEKWIIIDRGIYSPLENEKRTGFPYITIILLSNKM
jgi:hypothetical protein